MFWRKSRKAIDGFHPLHQGLIWQRTISVTLPPAEWDAVIASLARHDALVKRRKWSPPSRVRSVLVPLVRVLSEDMAPGAPLGITVDLRGDDLPEKSGPRQNLPVRRPVRSITQWYTFDPWLTVRAELRDGSVLELSVADRVRHRKIHKVNPRGKHKYKTKTKAVQRVTGVRTLPKGVSAHRPAAPPPPWISMKLRDDKRTILRVGVKFSPRPGEETQFDRIMTVTTELFRWTAPRMSA